MAQWDDFTEAERAPYLDAAAAADAFAAAEAAEESLRVRAEAAERRAAAAEAALAAAQVAAAQFKADVRLLMVEAGTVRVIRDQILLESSPDHELATALRRYLVATET